MGGFSWLVPRPAAAGDPTHALFAAQSHSIVDNLVALLRHRRAWNCSDAERVFGNTSGFAEREAHWNNVRYLRSFGNSFRQGVLPPVTQNRQSARTRRMTVAGIDCGPSRISWRRARLRRKRPPARLSSKGASAAALLAFDRPHHPERATETIASRRRTTTSGA